MEYFEIKLFNKKVCIQDVVYKNVSAAHLNKLTVGILMRLSYGGGVMVGFIQGMFQLGYP